jgi:hypothetical protein
MVAFYRSRDRGIPGAERRGMRMPNPARAAVGCDRGRSAEGLTMRGQRTAIWLFILAAYTSTEACDRITASPHRAGFRVSDPAGANGKTTSAPRGARRPAPRSSAYRPRAALAHTRRAPVRARSPFRDRRSSGQLPSRAPTASSRARSQASASRARAGRSSSGRFRPATAAQTVIPRRAGAQKDQGGALIHSETR